MTVDQMRSAIMDAYKGPLWRMKVQEMPNRQVIAVYKDMLRRGTFDPKPKIKNTDKKEEPKCIQLTIWDILNPPLKKDDSTY